MGVAIEHSPEDLTVRSKGLHSCNQPSSKTIEAITLSPSKVLTIIPCSVASVVMQPQITGSALEMDKQLVATQPNWNSSIPNHYRRQPPKHWRRTFPKWMFCRQSQCQWKRDKAGCLVLWLHCVLFGLIPLRAIVFLDLFFVAGCPLSHLHQEVVQTLTTLLPLWQSLDSYWKYLRKLSWQLQKHIAHQSISCVDTRPVSKGKSHMWGSQ